MDATQTLSTDGCVWEDYHRSEGPPQIQLDGNPAFQQIHWEDLVLGEKLGSGSFAEVYRASYRSNDVAVKRLRLPATAQARHVQAFVDEIRSLNRIYHPHCVALVGACVDLPNLAVVTEYMEMGDLDKLLHNRTDRLLETSKLAIIADVAKGLAYVHERGIVHRDLKPSNALLSRTGVCKVADMGLAFDVDASSIKTGSGAFCGTMRYMSPEALLHLANDQRSDVFSFGVLTWEVLTQQLPFDGIDRRTNAYAQLRLDAIPDVFPSVLRDIVAQCLHAEPSKRPLMADVLPYVVRMAPLLAAMEAGDSRDIRRLCVELPALLRTRTSKTGSTPLDAAIGSYQCTVECIDALVEAGADVNSPNLLGTSFPLFTAVSGACADAVASLIKHGCDVNQMNVRGYGALHRVSTAKSIRHSAETRVEIASILLAAPHADPDLARPGGQTPLMSAVIAGWLDVVVLLLSAGATVGWLDAEANLPLHLACCTAQRPSTMDERVRVVEVLVEAGSEIDALNGVGMTALMVSTQTGSHAIVQALLRMGAATETTDPLGRTALHHACTAQHRRLGRTLRASVAHSLLLAGAEVDRPDNDGFTPLLHASARGFTSVAQLCLDVGWAGTLTATDFYGNTCLHVLCDAPDAQHTELLRLLLERGLRPTVQNGEGRTPLMCAVANGHLKLCRILLEKRSKSVRMPDACGRLPLHVLAQSTAVGNEATRHAIAQLLVDAQSPLNKPDGDGYTPLHYALVGEHSALAQYFLAIMEGHTEPQLPFRLSVDSPPTSPMFAPMSSPNASVSSISEASSPFADPPVIAPPLRPVSAFPQERDSTCSGSAANDFVTIGSTMGSTAAPGTVTLAVLPDQLPRQTTSPRRSSETFIIKSPDLFIMNDDKLSLREAWTRPGDVASDRSSTPPRPATHTPTPPTSLVSTCLAEYLYTPLLATRLPLPSSGLIRERIPTLLEELALLNGVYHRNCLRMMGVSLTESEVIMVHERARGGSLAERLANQTPHPYPDEATGFYYVRNSSLHSYPGLPALTDAGRLRVLREVADALRFLHERGIHHGSLSASNVVNQDGVWKVSDFGLRRVCRLVATTGGNGSSTQARPLPLLEDMQRFGYLAWEVLTRGTRDDEAAALADLDLEFPARLPAGLRSFLRRCVMCCAGVDLVELPSAEEACDVLASRGLALWEEAIGNIESESVAALVRLLERDPWLVEARTYTGRSALRVAVACGSVQLASVCLDNGADTQDDYTGEPELLVTAVRRSHIQVARLLVDAGADLLARDSRGCSALALACGAWQADVFDVAAFVEAACCSIQAAGGMVAADVNHAGVTPLMVAVEGGLYAAAKCLLEHGADACARDFEGHSALHRAVRGTSVAGRRNTSELVNLLVSAGATPEGLRDCDRSTFERITRPPRVFPLTPEKKTLPNTSSACMLVE